MPIIDKLEVLFGNWLQDSEDNQPTFYNSIDEVPSMDSLMSMDTLQAITIAVPASVKNSVAYTYDYRG